MPFIIRIEALVGTVISPLADVRSVKGKFLKEYDPDAHEGRGFFTTTDRPEDAIQFGSHAAALAFWRRPSTVRPLREDGRPNRPLCAFTISVEDWLIPGRA